MLQFMLLFTLITSTSFRLVNSHQETGEWSCESDILSPIQANFRPGIITVDGHVQDWKDVDGFDFTLLPALDPHQDHAYKAGKMVVKALHDGINVFFMLEIDGDYVYSKGDNNKCPSVALMFQVGDNASYHNMGGCKEEPGACSSKTCQGHEVDIMHFSIGNAIPGRLYGGNPIDNREGNGGDRFGHLVDLYAWNPHCRYLDGIGPSGNDSSAQNDWKGAWWHESLTVHSGFVEGDSPYASTGDKGKFFFEFSRPMRTMDRLQQDVQFAIGSSSKLAVAFWYPIDGKPWYGSGHYSINCDWISLDMSAGSSVLTKMASRSSWPAASAFSLLLSVVALCLSLFVGYAVSRNKSIPFTPMDHL
ncbi:heme binding protein [Thalictrum thalictroides]|uniref:Heme binding protein n=1 Tax=Thalictrum thalictroides TaxID=46969 RepID=A0A7J6WT99_THATH|nr:heme binding protein [Thalictrum thalictroides]